MNHYFPLKRIAVALGLAGCALLTAHAGFAIAAPKTKSLGPATQAPPPPVQKPYGPAEIGPSISAIVGKSTLIRMPAPVDRISVGNPLIADVTLISPQEVYLLGKTVGLTNVIFWARNGGATIVDVSVDVDISDIRTQLRAALPNEAEVEVKQAADSLILSGIVSSAVAADQAVRIVEAYVRNRNRGLVAPPSTGAENATSISIGESRNVGGIVNAAGARVINMLKVREPQQVMLEVKVAEVNRTLLDRLGGSVRLNKTNGDFTFGLASDFLSDSAGFLFGLETPNKLLAIDAEKQDGLVKILAEPNIIAISGQDGEFLAGGRIFIPVARENNLTGGTTITLEEKDFGVRLKFRPTVLEGGRIHLVVAPEVSELSQTGTPFSTINGVTAVLPSFTVRNAKTSVQLNDGQSFAIAGLIRNNLTETVRRFPVLGELPILGALFRSAEFQSDKTELMFVVTPRLVKPLPANYALPTDYVIEPTRSEFFIEGRMEGRIDQQAKPLPAPQPAPDKGGFEVK